MKKRKEKTQFKKEILERDYPNLEVITMQRCNWDAEKKAYSKITDFLWDKIWLPEPTTSLQRGHAHHNHLFEGIRDGKLFGFVKCDVNVPEHKREEFADLPPVFKNIDISRDDIGPTMCEYAEQVGELKKPRRCLISSYFAKQQLFSTNLLQWYIKHGIEVKNISLFIQFRGDCVFEHLPQIVASARRIADLAATENPDDAFAMTLVGEMMKLVGNRYENLEHFSSYLHLES
jgi:hypothetical protein